jgi:hypothetical protein
MQNINRISRARLLSWAAIGLVVSVSPCFAADLGASQGMQPLGTAPAEIMPFRCDSLDPQVCFDIYQRRMEQLPAISGNLGIPGNLGGLPFSNEGWFAPNWSIQFEYRLGTPNIFGTVLSGGNNHLFR